ncbi:MAG TPA: VOC family protein [Thermosynechococcaceae cyanobacterium]
MGLNLTEAFVALGTADLDRLVQFYSQLLHEPAVYRAEVYAEFHFPDLKLGIFQPKNPVFAGSALSLCLEVENLEAAIAHLEAIGSLPLGKILTASHGREIYAADPDGNRIILHEARAAVSEVRTQLA